MSFPSKYRSTCGNCAKPIEPGQYINWTRRGIKKVWHQDCNNVWANPHIPTDINATINANANSEHIQESKAIAVSPESVTVNAMAVKPASNASALMELFAGELLPLIETKLDVKANLNDVKKLVSDSIQAELSQLTLPRELEVTVKTDTESMTRNIGKVHAQFDMLLKLCAAHSGSTTPINVWLIGPAGSGKTKAAEQVAEALGLKFYFSGAIAEPYSLLGYMDANGRLVRTAFREAYENGGIFLLDEVDGSSANALLSFNAALANGHCAFPDGVIKRDRDCIILAAANTFGLGGTSDYVGRVKLDAATLSRFVWLDWPYDESLERSLCVNQEWANRVIAIRHKVKSLGLKILVTPRASYTGDTLLSAGIPQAQVELMVIRQGMTEDQWNQVRHV